MKALLNVLQVWVCYSFVLLYCSSAIALIQAMTETHRHKFSSEKQKIPKVMRLTVI